MHTFKSFRNFMIEAIEESDIDDDYMDILDEAIILEAKSKQQYAKAVRDASFAPDEDEAEDDYSGPSIAQLIKSAEKEHGSDFAKQLAKIPDAEVFGRRTHGKGRTKPGQFRGDDRVAKKPARITKSGKMDKTQQRIRKAQLKRKYGK